MKTGLHPQKEKKTRLLYLKINRKSHHLVRFLSQIQHCKHTCLQNQASLRMQLVSQCSKVHVTRLLLASQKPILLIKAQLARRRHSKSLCNKKLCTNSLKLTSQRCFRPTSQNHPTRCLPSSKANRKCP